MPFFSFDTSYLLTTAIITLGIQVLFFAFAAALKTDKVTDLSYSLTFVLLAVILLIGGSAFRASQILVAVLIGTWGIRLGGYLFVRILSIKKDERFDGIREKPVRFAGFWLLQAVSVWTVMLPHILFLTSPEEMPLTFVSWLGAAVWLLGLLTETIADRQKYAFRKDPSHRDQWIQSGLWRFSRHPNFFGESLCWWGLFLVIVPVLQGWRWIGFVGPVSITVLLLFVSGVPTVEKRSNAKYGHIPEYQRYKERTSLFVLWPPRKREPQQVRGHGKVH